MTKETGAKLLNISNASSFGGQCSRCNISQVERIVSGMLGGTLTWIGLSKRSLGGLCTAVIGGSLLYRAVTGWCHAYEALGINTAGHSPQASLGPGEGFKIEKAITISRGPDELYRFWRHLPNLARVFHHIKSIDVTDAVQSHWSIQGPWNSDIEWDAEIIVDKPNDMIAWKSLDHAIVASAGSVHFDATSDGHETEVRVVLRYSPPAGRLGAIMAQWFQEPPEQQIAEELQKFKEYMEAGRSAASSENRIHASTATENGAGDSGKAQSKGVPGTRRDRFHIGDLVTNATGSSHGKVIGIEELPVGTIDPTNPSGRLYSVQWKNKDQSDGEVGTEIGQSGVRPEELRLMPHF